MSGPDENDDISDALKDAADEAYPDDTPIPPPPWWS